MAIKIDWSEEARAVIRLLDRTTAMFIFDGLLRYVRPAMVMSKLCRASLKAVSACESEITVLFSPTQDGIQIHTVRNRKNAYR